MLGLILLYFIGKAFYTLAEEHGKSKWPFAILGVVSYYVGVIVGGILIAILYEFDGSSSIDDVNDFLLQLMLLPFGMLACWPAGDSTNSSKKTGRQNYGQMLMTSLMLSELMSPLYSSRLNSAKASFV